jgi:acetyltransferase-like isoleucine patch superfamily enzyme
LLAAATARDMTPPPPSAFAEFGAGSWIVPPARVTCPHLVHVGARVIIQEYSWISVAPVFEGVTTRLTIGDGTFIDRLVHIACVGEIVIGPDVIIGERVLIGDSYHRYQDPDTPVIHQPMSRPEKVVVERGAHIGLAAIIGHGVTIGENAYVGAGAVVMRDVPARTVVVGNPARPVRRWDGEAWQAVTA